LKRSDEHELDRRAGGILGVRLDAELRIVGAVVPATKRSGVA
jgi:hypothetical protein